MAKTVVVGYFVTMEDDQGNSYARTYYAVRRQAALRDLRRVVTADGTKVVGQARATPILGASL